jgi:stage V sporulation protein AB
MKINLDIAVLFVWGLCIGIVVAAGVCALLTTVGIVTRIAWVTRTVEKVKCYENCILIGAAGFNVIYLIQPEFEINKIIANIILTIIGCFFGIFVGCLAMSLEEALDASTILFRRIKLNKNYRYIILMFAVGKLIGNWLMSK